MKTITALDIQKLRPNFTWKEEMYRIFAESQMYVLELYINSEYGLEYTLWDSDGKDIDGGVIDDFGISKNTQEQSVAIAELLNEFKLTCTKIRKMTEDEVLLFEERVNESWRIKVEKLKAMFKKKEA